MTIVNGLYKATISTLMITSTVAGAYIAYGYYDLSRNFQHIVKEADQEADTKIEADKHREQEENENIKRIYEQLQANKQ